MLLRLVYVRIKKRYKNKSLGLLFYLGGSSECLVLYRDEAGW